MENYNSHHCPPVGEPHRCTRFAYRRELGEPRNRVPSPFHFAWFFQNVNVGHGGLVATINAYYAVRTGAAYATAKGN